MNSTEGTKSFVVPPTASAGDAHPVRSTGSVGGNSTSTGRKRMATRSSKREKEKKENEKSERSVISSSTSAKTQQQRTGTNNNDSSTGNHDRVSSSPVAETMGENGERLQSTVRLLTYNMNLLPVAVNYVGHGYKDERLQAFIDRLGKAKYDILVLQEIFSSPGLPLFLNSWLCRQQRLITALKEKGFRYHATSHQPSYYSMATERKCTDSGLLILSRFPIVVHGSHTFRSAGAHMDKWACKGCLFAKVQLTPSEALIVFNCHLQATHLTGGRGGKYERARSEQVHELRQFVDCVMHQHPNCHHVIAGDFNVNAIIARHTGAQGLEASDQKYTPSLIPPNFEETDEYKFLVKTLDPKKKLKELLVEEYGHHLPTRSIHLAYPRSLGSMTEHRYPLRHDYLFFGGPRENPSISPVRGKTKIDKFPAQKSPYAYLSDHFGIQAQFHVLAANPTTGASEVVPVNPTSAVLLAAAHKIEDYYQHQLEQAQLDYRYLRLPFLYPSPFDAYVSPAEVPQLPFGESSDVASRSGLQRRGSSTKYLSSVARSKFSSLNRTVRFSFEALFVVLVVYMSWFPVVLYGASIVALWWLLRYVMGNQHIDYSEMEFGQMNDAVRFGLMPISMSTPSTAGSTGANGKTPTAATPSPSPTPTTSPFTKGSKKKLRLGRSFDHPGSADEDDPSSMLLQAPTTPSELLAAASPNIDDLNGPLSAKEQLTQKELEDAPLHSLPDMWRRCVERHGWLPALGSRLGAVAVLAAELPPHPAPTGAALAEANWFSYSDVDNLVCNISAGLAKVVGVQVGAGGVIGLLAEPNLLAFACQLAALRLGMSITLLKGDPLAVRKTIDQTGCDVCISSRFMLNLLMPCRSRVLKRIILLNPLDSDACEAAEDAGLSLIPLSEIVSEGSGAISLQEAIDGSVCKLRPEDIAFNIPVNPDQSPDPASDGNGNHGGGPAGGEPELVRIEKVSHAQMMEWIDIARDTNLLSIGEKEQQRHLSHRRLDLWSATSFPASGRYLSHQPIANMFENTMLWGCLDSGFSIAFTNEVQQAFFADCRLFRPTILAASQHTFATLKMQLSNTQTQWPRIKKFLFRRIFAFRGQLLGIGRDSRTLKLFFHSFERQLGGSIQKIILPTTERVPFALRQFIQVCYTPIVREVAFRFPVGFLCVDGLTPPRTLVKISDQDSARQFSFQPPCGQLLICRLPARTPHQSPELGESKPVPFEKEEQDSENEPSSTTSSSVSTYSDVNSGQWRSSGAVGVWREDGGLTILCTSAALLWPLEDYYVVATDLEREFRRFSTYVVNVFVTCRPGSPLVAIVVPHREAVEEWVNQGMLNKGTGNPQKRRRGSRATDSGSEAASPASSAFAHFRQSSGDSLDTPKMFPAEGSDEDLPGPQRSYHRSWTSLVRLATPLILEDFRRIAERGGWHSFQHVQAIHLHPHPFATHSDFFDMNNALRRNRLNQYFAQHINRLYESLFLPDADGEGTTLRALSPSSLGATTQSSPCFPEATLGSGKRRGKRKSWGSLRQRAHQHVRTESGGSEGVIQSPCTHWPCTGSFSPLPSSPDLTPLPSAEQSITGASDHHSLARRDSLASVDAEAHERMLSGPHGRSIWVSPLAIDIGGTCAKMVYFAPPSGPPLPTFVTKESKAMGVAFPRNISCFVPEGVEQDGAGAANARAKLRKAGTLSFLKMPTSQVPKYIDYIQRSGVARQFHWDEIKEIPATGGGAYKYSSLVQERLSIRFCQHKEMDCVMKGLNYLLANARDTIFTYDIQAQTPKPAHLPRDLSAVYPFLLVNIGSGVSVLKCLNSKGEHVRVGGSPIGGGTFWGLVKALTNITSWEEINELTRVDGPGDNTNLDLLVGDIYGFGATGLPAKLSVDTVASTFGKVGASRKAPGMPSGTEEMQAMPSSPTTRDNEEGGCDLASFRPPTPHTASSMQPVDVVRSLLIMIANNVTQLAYLLARVENAQNVFFTGGFVRENPIVWRQITRALGFWSNGLTQAHFFQHDGYLGALGALFANTLPPVEDLQ